ncbi:hypothetical protein ACQCN2_16190 [Brevibacillus ginsengisoli]
MKKIKTKHCKHGRCNVTVTIMGEIDIDKYADAIMPLIQKYKSKLKNK